MENLAQPIYEDANGRPIVADMVECLAPFIRRGDGFYQWVCGKCNRKNDGRWWKISGRVVACCGCRALNLLVRTDCDHINELGLARNNADSNKAELQRLKDIEQYNEEQLQKLRQEILAKLAEVVTMWRAA